METSDQVYMNVEPIINLGFDLHGVLDTYADCMVPLLEKLCNAGYAIHILSGPSKQEVEQKLLELGYKPEFHFHYLFSIVDYLKASGVEMWKDSKGTWWSQDEIWWKSKGYYCKLTHCEYLFDNSDRYRDYMPLMTDFIYIKTKRDADEMIEMLTAIISEESNQ